MYMHQKEEIATNLLAVSDLLWQQILKELWIVALGVVLLCMYVVSIMKYVCSM